jgi:hypothetical protein
MHNFIPDAADSLTDPTHELQVCDCGFAMPGVKIRASLAKRMSAFTIHYGGVLQERIDQLTDDAKG